MLFHDFDYLIPTNLKSRAISIEFFFFFIALNLSNLVHFLREQKAEGKQRWQKAQADI